MPSMQWYIRLPDIRQQPVNALIIEPHAIDDGACLGDAKQTRFWVSRLGTGRNRADFDKAEAKRRKRLDMLAILVQSGSQAYRIGKIQAHDSSRLAGYRIASRSHKPNRRAFSDCIKGNAMSCLGIETE